MQYRVYITALQYGSEIIEAESEDEAKQEIETLFRQHRISCTTRRLLTFPRRRSDHEQGNSRPSSQRHHAQ